MIARVLRRRAMLFAILALAATSGCWVVAGLEDRPVVDGLTEAGDGAPPDSDTPPGCDGSKDPKDSPCLVVDLGGVFVAPNGDDAADGTKSKPLRTIATAVKKAAASAKSRVFVCEGTYPDPVVLDAKTDGVSLFGGFTCGDFQYTGSRPRLAPAVAGYALRVDGLTKPLRIQDFDIVARDAAAAGQSSIGALVTRAQTVAFKRVKIAAGAGAKGAEGAGPPATNHLPNAALQAAASPSTTSGPQPKTCTCPITGSGTSTGGHGGNAQGLPNNGGAGTASPVDPLWVDGMFGIGGVGNPPACGTTGVGQPGGAGAGGIGGAPADRLGTITAEGWTPSEASAGSPGKPGQGGGGGAANNNQGGAPIGGGGGGCGSCGGAGGSPGKPGGSSIALVVFDAAVTFAESCVLLAAAGGEGGGGGTGEAAQVGGGGGPPNDSGFDCSGAAGGPGAGGSGGAGGTGGLSAGIAYARSGPPSFDGVAVQGADVHPAVVTGTAGGGGKAGAGGTAAPANFGAPAGIKGTEGKPGLPAVAKAVLLVP